MDHWKKKCWFFYLFLRFIAVKRCDADRTTVNPLFHDILLQQRNGNGKDPKPSQIRCSKRRFQVGQAPNLLQAEAARKLIFVPRTWWNIQLWFSETPQYILMFGPIFVVLDHRQTMGVNMLSAPHFHCSIHCPVAMWLGRDQLFAGRYRRIIFQYQNMMLQCYVRNRNHVWGPVCASYAFLNLTVSI